MLLLQTPTAAASIIPAIWNGRSEARADWLAHNGASNAALLAQGIVFAVRECHVLYLHPARLDDVLGITRKLQTGKARLRSCNGLPWMIGMRPYPGHPGLPQRRGPSGADTA